MVGICRCHCRQEYRKGPVDGSERSPWNLVVDSLRQVSILGVTCPLTCAQRRESTRPRETAGSCPRRSPCSCQRCPRCTPAASRPTDILHRPACACARLLALGCMSLTDPMMIPHEFLSCNAYLDNPVMRYSVQNFIERTQPHREPPMSMDDQRSDIGHCPQAALWDETVKKNRVPWRERQERGGRRERVGERESICNQSYFSLTCADKSEQPTGPRTSNNAAAAHAASVLDVHQCGARESCLWSPPASAHFVLAF